MTKRKFKKSELFYVNETLREKRQRIKHTNNLRLFDSYGYLKQFGRETDKCEISNRDRPRQKTDGTPCDSEYSDVREWFVYFL